MSYPLQFGLPQILLLLVAFVALVLLGTALVEVRRGERKFSLRSRLRVGRGVSGLVLLAAAGMLLWGVALIQTFLGLTGEVKAAHVVATPIRNVPHALSVEVTQYDEKGRTSSREVYQVVGDLWVLQADIVELKHWVNVLGVHSGYKVTRLFGERADGTATAQDHIFLNGGHGDFFTQLSDGAWWSKPFVRSAYGNAVISTPGEFDVYISQDAIKTRPAGR